MRKSENLIEIAEKFGAHNYLPLPVVLTRSEGSRVWDADGKEYLDFLSCYSALNFGHQHPRLLNVLVEQSAKLSVCSRAFHSEPLALFVKQLAEYCGLDSVLAMNSGTEAVETALKVARKWGYQKKAIAENRAKIIAMENNFHGRSVTVVSFSSEELYRKEFGPFTPGFDLAPFGDIQALEKLIDEDTVGVLLEPIQAEAGILIPPNGYLSEVRRLCSERNLLMLTDEIQTGMGRTGKDFCFQHENAKPDILILGKSLGGGLLPLSAIVAKKDVMEVIQPGEHGSTFGGNPLACAVGSESLRVLKEEKLSERSAHLGKIAMEFFGASKHSVVKEIRGKGSLIGIELHASAGGARRYCEELARQGVLCKETHDHVVRIAPPLNIEEELFLAGLKKIDSVLKSA